MNKPVQFTADPAYPPQIVERASQLYMSHYEQLKNLARSKRRNANMMHTLSTTDLLHESLMRVMQASDDSDSPWQDRSHFMATAVLAMRHVITDHARSKLRAKRGGGERPAPLENVAEPADERHLPPDEVVAVSDLLGKLGEQDPDLARVVDCLYFAGFTIPETADIIGVSPRTVKRYWTKARAWLKVMITESPEQLEDGPDAGG